MQQPKGFVDKQKPNYVWFANSGKPFMVSNKPLELGFQSGRVLL
uniref:Uncharacterized protein n=1 Tax=Picea glauca TaxID=3330 RepID=A0A117NGP3_PICGL|nr:hypothetical protein ABT39_MTgene6113 [Picea glauca]